MIHVSFIDYLINFQMYRVSLCLQLYLYVNILHISYLDVLTNVYVNQIVIEFVYK